MNRLLQSPAHTCQDNPGLLCPGCLSPEPKNDLTNGSATRALESLTPINFEFGDGIKPQNVRSRSTTTQMPASRW